MRNLIPVFIIAIFGGSNLHAETVSFPVAWDQINKSSAAQEASRLQTEVLREGQARASRHWLPKVYLDAKGYQTNDPGASFFGLLEQRSLRQTDFTPDSINHPDAQVYARGALGVDLPLFEGGMRSAQVDVLKHSVESQKNTTLQVQLEQYSQAGLAYGSMLILDAQKTRLATLNAETGRMIKSYQLGNKSNPVGYSGLLGMKSLANRLVGLMSQYQSQSNAYRASLNEMGLTSHDWQPNSDLEPSDFVSRFLLQPKTVDRTTPSYRSQAANEGVKASAEMEKMEKAKFLPKVGAFAETYVFNGNRDTANGYNAGLYLQWNLFDPSDYGALHETKLRSKAAAKYLQASDQQERAERAALAETLESLRENIRLLDESYKMLLEQSRMTDTLFRNGSINALQIVEILSRRTDLIVQQADAELGLVKTASFLITKSKFDIADRLKNQTSAGAPREKK